MKYIYFLIFSGLILFSSCGGDEFTITTSEVEEEDIDTSYINSGEIYHNYNGDNFIYGSTGYPCSIFDGNDNIVEKNYFITNGEYLPDEDIIVLMEDGFLIFYNSVDDIIGITLSVDYQGQLRPARNIDNNQSIIVIQLETDDFISGIWEGEFEVNIGGDIDEWVPIGIIEGDFYVPSVKRCE